MAVDLRQWPRCFETKDQGAHKLTVCGQGSDNCDALHCQLANESRPIPRLAGRADVPLRGATERALRAAVPGGASCGASCGLRDPRK